jgi:glycosyltransferase involved in cell wall biosynthesis
MGNNPLVSIVAVSYNQERYIKDSLMSLLSQDYSPLQIIVSDDHSTDSTFQILTDIAKQYDGPHELILHRNEFNLGIGGNRNKAIELAKGELLVTADGDDISAPNRVSTLVNYWNLQSPRPLLITTDAIDFTESGEILEEKRCDDLQKISNPQSFITNKPLFWGCTNIYSRELIDRFGGINIGVGADDQIIVLRSILLGRVHSLHKALVRHRQGGVGSISASSAKTKGVLLTKKAPIATADLNQMLEDAKKVGREAELLPVLKKPMAEAKFTEEIAVTKGFKETFRLFQKYSDAPLLKRIRIYIYIHIPSINQIYFIFKKDKV